MSMRNRLAGVSKIWSPNPRRVVLLDPENSSATAPHGEAAGADGGRQAAKNGVRANGEGASPSESLVPYGSGSVEPASAPEPRARRGRGLLLLSLGGGILLAGGLATVGFTSWVNHLQVPGSLADEEYHAYDRTVAQYEKWRKEILDRINGGGDGAGAAKKLGRIEAKVHFPPEEAVHACLRRHLPGDVSIISIEPVAYRSVGNAEELDYRVTVESAVDLYVVPALAAPGPPENAPGLVKEVWPDLLWDATLPPGMEFKAGEKDRYLLAKADQKVSFLWKIEKAQVVDGKWRIQRVAPPLLEWSNGFFAAGLDNALRGGGAIPPLFLCRSKDLEEYSASFERCLADLHSRYDAMEADVAQARKELGGEVTKAPKGIRKGIDLAAVRRARSEGFQQGMEEGGYASDALSNLEGTTRTGVIPWLETVTPFVGGLVHSKKAEKEEIARQRAAARAEYRAQWARHIRELKEAEQKGNQYQAQQESRFVQYYRDLADQRVSDIRRFIQKTAVAEDAAGGARNHRSLSN
ncbi:protein of unknown function [Methylacidimicrobium sp. AP8]|uniref:hypothetical protein n=1 Tax=Methylacidimicrobium sp. AP8 TaxID=2730359 RepID=UPI0018C0064C|nr:hypothetical protein [Methylacidimicrobium sp. AP8]CAB4242962.1 protein of unknown function [Methylacidimicrobium sp. AP8]